MTTYPIKMNTAPLTKEECLSMLILLSSLESLYLASHASRPVSVPDHMWDQITETTKRLSNIVLHSGID